MTKKNSQITKKHMTLNKENKMDGFINDVKELQVKSVENSPIIKLNVYCEDGTRVICHLNVNNITFHYVQISKKSEDDNIPNHIIIYLNGQTPKTIMIGSCLLPDNVFINLANLISKKAEMEIEGFFPNAD